MRYFTTSLLCTDNVIKELRVNLFHGRRFVDMDPAKVSRESITLCSSKSSWFSSCPSDRFKQEMTFRLNRIWFWWNIKIIMLFNNIKCPFHYICCHQQNIINKSQTFVYIVLHQLLLVFLLPIYFWTHNDHSDIIWINRFKVLCFVQTMLAVLNRCNTEPVWNCLNYIPKRTMQPMQSNF